MHPQKIILVFKTHFDIGFTDLSSRVVVKYASQMLEEVIATCKGTQDLGKLKYVWTMPAWPLWYIINNCVPELKIELDALIEGNQVVWHALPFTSHTDCCSQMEYSEGLSYAKKLSEMYHKTYPVSAKMTDVPGHSIMLPDILCQAGVMFLHLGCNEFATPPKVPELFFWETPGGRQILTMYSKGGYGTSLMPPDDWKFPVWMALMHTNDNSGPQSAEAIRRMQEQIRERYPETEVISGTMDDFYHELEQCDLSSIPVVKGDLADTWIHGVGSYPSEMALMRMNRRKMTVLQALYAKNLFEGGMAEGEAESILDRYYEETCLFEEHTWGADVKTWLGSNRAYEKKLFLKEKEKDSYQFMESSWEEQRSRAHRACESLESFEKFLEKSGQTGSYALFHAESSDYTGWVRLPEYFKEYDIFIENQKLLCGWIGQERCCYVEKLSGFERHSLRLQNNGAIAERTKNLSVTPIGMNLMVENHRYRLTFSEETGDFLELYDKKLNQTMLRASNSEGIFAYRYDKYGYDDINEYLRCYGYHFSTWGIQDYGREGYPLCGHETFFPTFVKYELKGNQISFFYKNGESVEKYGNTPMAEVQITLPEAGDKLFVTLQLTGKSESPYVESGAFVIPFAGETAELRIQKGGTLLDPSKDLVSQSNHCLYCLENGIVVMDESTGICIQTLDAPLAAFGEPGIYQYRPEFVEPERKSVYINLFNNMWGTNFPQWIGGDMIFRFEISCFARKKEDEEKALMELMQGYLDSVIVTGDIPETNGIRFPEGLKLLGARKYKKGICLYFSEVCGKSDAKIFSAKGFLLCPLDLMGGPEETMRKDRIMFYAVPYGMQGVYLERAL